MKIGVIGMSCRTASLDLREQFGKALQQIFGDHRDHSLALAPIVLTTCNRAELYFYAEDLSFAHTYILHHLDETLKCEFKHELYTFFGVDAFRHLGRVTSGLDSKIVSETEIQKQVKSSYEFASLDRDLPKELHYLFQKALSIGKRVRTTYPLPGGVPELEHIAYQIGSVIVPKFEKCNMLFFGNSEMNRKIIPYFKAKSDQKITLCTRTPKGADKFAKQMNIEVQDWSLLKNWHKYDAIICAAARAHQVIEANASLADLRTRFIVDLSMPRNVCPTVADNTQLNLLNIEQIGDMVHQKRAQKLQEVDESEEMTDLLSSRYHALYLEKAAGLCA